MPILPLVHACCFDPHNGLDGAEQVLQNPKTSKLPRLFYYQEENSTDDSCVVALFMPVIAIFSGWEQNGSVIIQSKTVLAFITYMVNHFILCFQTAPSSISILESKKPFVVLITTFQRGANLLRFPYWHIIFDHFKQLFESSDAT